MTSQPILPHTLLIKQVSPNDTAPPKQVNPGKLLQNVEQLTPLLYGFAVHESTSRGLIVYLGHILAPGEKEPDL